MLLWLRSIHTRKIEICFILFLYRMFCRGSHFDLLPFAASCLEGPLPLWKNSGMCMSRISHFEENETMALLTFPYMLIMWGKRGLGKSQNQSYELCTCLDTGPLLLQSVPVNPADSFNTTTLFLSHSHKIPCQGTNHNPPFLGFSYKNYFRINLNVKSSRTLNRGDFSSLSSQHG